MIPHKWVDSTDLNAWANRIDSQSMLPQLLCRLVHATTRDLQRVDFPSGDSVQMGGWDGSVVTSSGNAFVPSGYSVWELGTNRGVKQKADSDYQKRSDNPLDVVPIETIFVFVTIRRWGGKEKWTKEKNTEGIWAEVRAYDASDIEQWLGIAPAVHSWLAQILGKWSEDTQDLGSFWQDWADLTSPSLHPKMHLAGRDEEMEKLDTWLEGNPSKITIHSPSKEEAIAFFAARLHSMVESERIRYLAKCVLVKSEALWKTLAVRKESLILIPTFSPIKSIPQEHHVLIPIGNEISPPQDCLKLSRQSRQSFREGLSEMSFPTEKTYALTKQSRRSIAVLRYLLAKDPEMNTPSWAAPENAQSLVPILLAGAWNDSSESDQKIISLLAHKPYEEVVESLSRWLNDSEPPIRKIGNVWQIVSRDVSWHLLSRFILSTDLKCFDEVVLSVLEEEDPKYELPIEKRYAASLYGKQLSHSNLLREGLTETLAVLATVGLPSETQELVLVQDRVDAVVSSLLNADADNLKWASMSPLLPTLAEAAPEVFLSALERDLAKEHPVALSLFNESQTGSSAHTNLLWALEMLAWKPDYLARVAISLAQLSRLDPGGKILNRPFNSLRDIFQLIHPQTTASIDRRLKIIDMLVLREPAVTWRLLFSLLPTPGGTFSISAYKPRWRKWTDEYDDTITYQEYWQGVDSIIQRVLSAIGTDVDKLCNVIKQLGALPPDARSRTIDFISSLEPETISDSDLAKIWNALRQLVYKHKEFPDAKWAMSVEIVNQLEIMCQRFEPEAITTKHSSLFSYAPCILTDIGLSRSERETKANEYRVKAAADIYSESGISSLLRMADSVERPDLLGAAIAKIEFLEGSELDLLDASLGQCDTPLRKLAICYIRNRFANAEWDWAEPFLSTIKSKQWPHEKIVSFFHGLPFASRSWQLLDLFDEAVNKEYWKTMSSRPFEVDEVEAAVRSLLLAQRPWAALDLSVIHLDDPKLVSVSPITLMEVLERSASMRPEKETPPLNTQIISYDISHNIDLAFDALDESELVSQEEISRLEWIYFSALTNSHRQPKVLYQQLSCDPLLFALVVSFVYKSEDEQEATSDVNEATAAFAIRCYELLQKWHWVPGLVDGVLDSEKLRDWIEKAREECQKKGIRGNADSIIGEMLARLPKDSDGSWPSKDVADIIEQLSSEEVELGISIGIYNKRGVFGKAIDEGGIQEKTLAETYEANAETFVDTHPRTASMLNKVAKGYRSDAHREDVRAELVD